MTDPQARQLLHSFACQVHAQGWSYGDFLFNFDQAWGLAPQDVTDAAARMPGVLEHIAHIVWYPTRRDI